MKIFNTLTRKLEKFIPNEPKEVKIYSCGPTVYNFAHIGNFRAYIVADLLKRYLQYKSFSVKHVMNITDIDDKTIKNSIKEGKKLKEFTEFYTQEFFKDIDTLNIQRADIYPRATDHIQEMIDLIKKLKEFNHTYEQDGSVYYKITTLKDYGKLARIDLSNLKNNAEGRLKKDEYEKDDARDFALWKSYEESDGDIFFDTCFGKGRPGWHIECSAMSMKYLGENFDIHTGGVDLIFPHHTNEIAQSEGVTGKQFVNYWIHNEHLLVEGKKMSKSLGNFYTLRDIISKGYDPKAIRLLLLSTHYRQKLNFSFSGLDNAKKNIDRIQELVDRLLLVTNQKGENFDEFIKNTLKKFQSSMDNDLNIGDAMVVIFEAINYLNKEFNKINKEESDKIINMFKKFDSILGIINFKIDKVPSEIINLAEKRQTARKNKDWQEADRLRNIIKEKGYIISDTNDSYRIKKSE